MNQMLDSLLSGVPHLLAAIIYLIIALIVSSIAKKIVVSGGRKLGLTKIFNKFGIGGEQQEDEILALIGKIVYFIVFILFLPGILERLNIQGVSAPLIAMSTALLGYLPNILAFVIIMAVGVFIARIVKQILLSLLGRLNIDRLQEKAGIQSGEGTVKFSALLANIVYGLILVTVTIAALEVLNISAISTPALSMLNAILGMVPNVFVAIVLVAIGVIVAKIVGGLLGDLLSSTGINGWLSKIMGGAEGKWQNIQLSRVIGEIVRYVIILLFAVEAVTVLHLEVLHTAGSAIIAYLPALLSAVIILGAGFFLSQWLSNLLGKLADSKVITWIVRYAILLITVFMTLNQLGVAPFIVNTTFIVVFGAIAVAAAIAFGVGGKDFAAKVLGKIDLDQKN